MRTQYGEYQWILPEKNCLNIIWSSIHSSRPRKSCNYKRLPSGQPLASILWQQVWRMTNFNYSTIRHQPNFCVTPAKISTVGTKILSFLRLSGSFGLSVTPGRLNWEREVLIREKLTCITKRNSLITHLVWGKLTKNCARKMGPRWHDLCTSGKTWSQRTKDWQKKTGGIRFRHGIPFERAYSEWNRIRYGRGKTRTG